VEAADVRFSIPVVGFIQSFNVSVAAAITLQMAVRGRAIAEVRGVALPVHVTCLHVLIRRRQYFVQHYTLCL